MTVKAAHAKVTSIKNLNLKIIPCQKNSQDTVPSYTFSYSARVLLSICDTDIKPNLITQPPSLWHSRKMLYFPTNVPEHATHHATQGEEIQTNRNPCHNDEG